VLVKTTLRVLLVVAAVLALASADAVAGGFLKYEGIDGESKDRQHKGWIDVESWNWGMEQSEGMTARSMRGSSGRANFKGLVITKKVDSATPGVMRYFAQGNRLREVLFEVSLGGDGPATLRMVLTNAQVTSVHIEEAAGGGRATERVSISFSKVKVIHTGPRGSVEFNWDLESGSGR
jgi:type VI secretion system secreted protein Hcp